MVELVGPIYRLLVPDHDQVAELDLQRRPVPNGLGKGHDADLTTAQIELACDTGEPLIQGEDQRTFFFLHGR